MEKAQYKCGPLLCNDNISCCIYCYYVEFIQWLSGREHWAALTCYNLHLHSTYEHTGTNTVEVVQHSCNQQTLYYTLSLCDSRNIRLFFFNPACSKAERCNVLTPSSAILNPLPQLYSHILMKKGWQKKRKLNFHLSSFKWVHFSVSGKMTGSALVFSGVLWDLGVLSVWLCWTTFNTVTLSLMIHGWMAYDPPSSIQIV